MANIVKFEVGAMYWDTSAVDHNDVMVIKITRRTEKSVWFVRMHNGKEDGEPSRTKIFTDATREYVMPYKYSMAPVWSADRKVEPEQTAPEADAVTPDEPETETATPDAPANDEPETVDGNKAAAMTAQEAAARKMIAEQTTEYLLKTWESTTTNNDPFIPTVRGWLMDELESRFPEAYDKWLGSETCEDAALRKYIEAAEQGAAKADSKEEKKMTLTQLFVETRMEFAKEEIDGVMVYTGGGEYCEPFGDVAEVLNRYGDREIEPIYLGGDEPASMTEPDAHGMIHVALVEAQEEAQDSAEAEADSAAAEFDNSEIGYAEIIRMLGADANAYFQKGDAAKAAEMKAGIRLNLEAAERSGIALEVEYDADGRFTDVRERTEAADDGAAAGQPAPQADAAPEGAESVEAEAASAVRATRNPVAPYDLFQFHAESGTYLFENEGEAALIDALEFHANRENALSVVRALYEIAHDGGGWFSPRNHPVMLDALNSYIDFLTAEIEVYDNFPNAAEKEIAVGKLAEAKVIRDAFAADFARAAA